MRKPEAVRVTPEEFRGIRDHVRGACGIALGDDKAYLVETRLGPLLPRFGLGSFGELRRALAQPGAGVLRRAVIDAIVTGETSWFRDEHPFRAYREVVLPRLHAERRKFRLWSAGCSTGQEPYSLAMGALEFYAGRGGARECRERVEILGTDVSEAALDAARAGFYDGLQVARGLAQVHRERHFRSEKDGWRVGDEVRSLVRFQAVNLLDPLGALGLFDGVFLRNVTIYFSEATKQAVLQKVARCLRPGGTLFLGATESLPALDGLFRPDRHGGATFYVRQEG
ncbi:MAG: protein-glutamate O-methyltransferase CheR [Thermodesulfobacteriota bacterium]